MDDAFDEAISLSPATVGEALDLLRDGIWMDPEDATEWDFDAALEAQTLVDGYAVDTCGVSVFDPRITEDNREVPSVEDTPQVDLGPDYLADRQAMMTQAGGIRMRWEMPTVNLIDGPRKPSTMNPPAIVTYWAHGGEHVPVRYDAMLLVDVAHLGDNDDEVAREALTQIGGGAPIQFQPSRRSNGRLRIDFSQNYDNRVYLGRAYSWGGNVFALTVAVPWHRQDLADAAVNELMRLDASLTFEPV